MIEENVTDNERQLIYKYMRMVVKSCIDEIEQYRIPVGNSSAGEITCILTYNALHEIKDSINDKFKYLDQD